MRAVFGARASRLRIAALVRLSSKGPVLFGDEREGLSGRPFRCWKFRTMVDGAHAQQRYLYAQNQLDGPQFKLDHDPRVTWIGRLLRPKESGLSANFYTLVARDTVDQDFAQNRQRFLAEQGYSYTILDAHALAAA